MAGKKLTPKEAKFVEEYLVDLNAAGAARRAGYSQKTAKEIGFSNLTKVHIQEAISKARQELSAKCGITPEKVIRGFASIAFSDLAECYDENGNLRNIHDIPEEVRQAIAGIEIFQEFEGRGEGKEKIGITSKVKRWDKVRALENLAKHFGLYDEDKSNRDFNVSLVMTMPE